MNRGDIQELHYIAPIDNVPSIMIHGILPRNKVRNIKHCDISESEVQNRRAFKKIPGTNKRLHDYVNLYFDAHNPMLSARRHQNNDVCVLRVKNTILDQDGVIVTDKNAARDCWFKTVDEGLLLLNKKEVYAEFWLNDNYLEQERLKGIKCAEVLVPECVKPCYIFGAYAANENVLKKLCQIPDISGIINSNLFFY